MTMIAALVPLLICDWVWCCLAFTVTRNALKLNRHGW
jgi:hypothetical protein